ncbi:MAG: glutathione S-transferase [Pseudomonadota bacterium]|jgi:glutathione S-transferase
MSTSLASVPTVTAFQWVPPFAQGVVRDLRVRWAMEEAGLPYGQRLIGPPDQTTADYRRLQPFGQVPVYQEPAAEGGLALFESGAIVLHIAEQSSALMPTDPAARARAVSWIFAALNSVEPPISNLAEIDLFNADAAWAKERRPEVVEQVRKKLANLADWLGDREHLEGPFTAGDLMMVTVLRNLRHTELVAETPSLKAYQQRGEARPAFQKALAAQLAAFEGNAPPGA